MVKKVATDKPSRLNPLKKTFPYLMLIILLFLSVIVWQYYKGNTLAREERRFNEYVDNTVARVFEQIHENNMVLIGVAGVFAATTEVDQEEWSAYFEYQQIVTEHPGIRDAVFARVVQPFELEQHLETLRAEGHLEYTVWPEGEREVYTPIVFVAPFTESYRAGLGFDMYSDPLRRATMEKARDTGAAAISGKMTIVTETGPTPPMGFIMIVPVYAKSTQPNTPEERRAAIMGYISSFFRIEELLAGTFTDPAHEIDFHLYDGTEISAETLLYDSHITPEEDHERRPLFTSTETIDLYGHQWTMVFESMPAFEAVVDLHTNWAILGAGLLLSVLIFLYLKSLTTTGDRARTLARKMTNELKESEEQLKKITDNVTDAVALCNIEGNVTYLSPQSHRVLGFSPEELLGKPIFTIVCEEDLPAMMQQFNDSLEAEEPGSAEYRIATKDGHLVWVETRGDLLYENGQVSGAVFVTRDITERKQLEEKINQSRKMYKSVVDTQQELLCRYLPDTTLTFVNDAYCRTFGKSRSELLGQKFLMFLPPEAHEEEIASLNNLTPANPNVTKEFGVLLADGSTAWQVWTDQALFDEKGKVIEIQGVGHDITSRKEAEDKIRESEKMLRETQAAAGIGSYVVDVEGDTCQSSAALSDLLGIDDKEIHPLDLWPELIHPDQKEDVLKAHQKAIDGGTDFNEEYMIIRQNDSNIRWVLDRGVLEFDLQGKPKRLIGTIMDITERKQKEEEIKARQEELAALYSFSTSMRAANDTNTLLSIAVDESSRLLQADACMVSLLAQDESCFTITAGKGFFEDSVGLTFPSDQGLSGMVLQTKKPVCKDNYNSEPLALSLINYDQIGPIALVPLRTEEAIVGMLVVARRLQQGDKKSMPFTAAEVDLLSAMGEIAGNAMRRQSLYESAQNRLKRVQALRNIDMAITSSLDLRVTLKVVLDEVTNLLGVDAAAILRIEPHTNILKYDAWRGFNQIELAQFSFSLKKGLAGRAAMNREYIQIPDYDVAEINAEQNLIFEKEGFKSYYAVPLIAKGLVQGVLEIYNRKPLDSNNEWRDFLETLAGQAAIAIDNAELFHQLETTNMDLIQAYDATIEGWAHALDLKDEETEGHSRRVTELTVNIARKMDVKQEELAHVRRGALLHDIGKMGIPDSILLKPGKLTEEEWEVMRKHPVYAYEMLAPVDYLRPALDIPYCHHEKWDGTGYPRGLKGTAIPLSARIFAVVDVYDALTSDRPYRKAWSEEDTLALIKEDSGSHFDPYVVEVFLKEIEGSSQGIERQ